MLWRITRCAAFAFALAALGCGSDVPHHQPASAAPLVDAGRMPIGGAGGNAGETVVHVPQTMHPTEHADAGALPDEGTANGFAVAMPVGPRSTARIRGMVLDETLVPIATTGAASAGGAFVATGATGLFLIDEVYGSDAADVTVHAFGYTQGHVRVPIRDGEISYAVIVLKATNATVIGDLARGGEVATADEINLDLPAGALATAWGEPANGRGTLSAALLATPAQAAAVPGGMVALQGSTRVRLHARAMFELEVAQGGTRFELQKAAAVVVPLQAELPAPDADPDAAVPIAGDDQLYWFDPQAAAFVERGSVTEDMLTAHAQIDRFGFWAVARVETALDCVHGTVVDSKAAPVPFAALIMTDVERFDSVALFADAQGEFCADARAGSTVSMFAFGRSATDGPLTAKGAQVSVRRYEGPLDPAVCADATTCVEFGAMQGWSLNLRCMRGTLKGALPEVYWRTTDQFGHIAGGIFTLAAGASFCLETPVPGTLGFSALGGDCGADHTVDAGFGLCGEDSDCVDLGTVTCCEERETCGDGIDGNCNGEVDENCVCGTSDCAAVAVDQRCCAGDVCGGLIKGTDTCLGVENEWHLDPVCPTAPPDVMTGASPASCCRSDGRCGLLALEFGCVALDDAHLLFTLTPPPAPMSCTP